MALTYGMYAQGTWRDERGANVIDTGSPWYEVYQTKDAKWLSVGAIEQRFYAEFVAKLGLTMAELPQQHDRSGWPDLRRRFAEAIASRRANGGAHLPAVTLASPRYCRSRRSARSSTTRCAARLRFATASCSQLPLRALAGPPARWVRRLARAAPTAMPC
jgi:hypothetical protein